MGTYVVVAESTGSPCYTIGVYSSEEFAKMAIEKYFGKCAKKIDILQGSAMATICQYKALRTIVSIHLHELDSIIS